MVFSTVYVAIYAAALAIRIAGILYTVLVAIYAAALAIRIADILYTVLVAIYAATHADVSLVFSMVYEN